MEMHVGPLVIRGTAEFSAVPLRIPTEGPAMMHSTSRKTLLAVLAGALAVGLVTAAPLAASAVDQKSTRVTAAGKNLTTLIFKNELQTGEIQTVSVYVLTTWKSVSSSRATLTEVAYSISENSKNCFSVDAAYNGSPSGELGVKRVCPGSAAIYKKNIVTTTSAGNRGQVFARFKSSYGTTPTWLTVEYHN